MSSSRYAKQEQSERKRKAGRPLFGCFALIIFGAFSWVIAPSVRQFVEKNSGLRFPGEWPVWLPDALVALFILAVLFSVAMTIIALSAGPTGDPRDVRVSDAQFKKRGRRR